MNQQMSFSPGMGQVEVDPQNWPVERIEFTIHPARTPTGTAE